MENLSITTGFWIYCGLFALHELEEWNIARFEQRVFQGLPAVHTDRNARAWMAVVCLFSLAWCGIASLFPQPSVSAAIFLPAIFFAATNALQHVYWSLRFRAVAPGVVTAVVLILPASIYLVWQVLTCDLASPWYVAGLSTVLVLVLAGTIKSGTSAPAVIPVIYGIGDRAVRMLGLRGSRR